MRARLGVALLLAACGSDAQVRRSDYTPGELDAQQLARCREVAESFQAGADDHAARREQLRDDPAAIGWYVRYLEAEIVRVREGSYAVEGQERFAAARGARDDLHDKQQAARIRAYRAGEGAAEWQLVANRPDSRAIAEIVAIGMPAIEVVVNDLLLSGQEFLRSIAVDVLAGIGEPAVAELLRIVREGSVAEQRAAVRALGAIGAGGDAFRALEQLADSSQWRLRSEVARAFGGGGAAARDALIGMLDDDDAFVRRQVAAALGRHRGDAVAMRALVDFLEASQRGEDMDAEVAAQQALQTCSGTRRMRSVADWRAYLETVGR